MRRNNRERSCKTRRNCKNCSVSADARCINYRTRTRKLVFLSVRDSPRANLSPLCFANTSPRYTNRASAELRRFVQKLLPSPVGRRAHRATFRAETLCGNTRGAGRIAWCRVREREQCDKRPRVLFAPSFLRSRLGRVTTTTRALGKS